MIVVYRVCIDGDEYFGRDMRDVQFLLKVKAHTWLDRAPITLSITHFHINKAEFEALPEWGL